MSSHYSDEVGAVLAGIGGGGGFRVTAEPEWVAPLSNCMVGEGRGATWVCRLFGLLAAGFFGEGVDQDQLIDGARGWLRIW